MAKENDIIPFTRGKPKKYSTTLATDKRGLSFIVVYCKVSGQS